MTRSERGASSPALLAALALPAAAAGRRTTPSTGRQSSARSTSIWVIVAALLVMFMQAGFAFLEIGFSRGKNAGTGVAKIFVNFSIATIAWWAVGFAFAFGGAGAIVGDAGFFLATSARRSTGVRRSRPGHRRDRRVHGLPVHVLRRLAGDRLGHDARAHQVRRLRHLRRRLRRRSSTRSPRTGSSAAASCSAIGGGVQDFAGSTVVHLVGATGALAVLLLLGPRRGKYGPDGKPRAIPGHSMPLVGLGVLILWLGWFGFNARLDARHDRQPLRRGHARHPARRRGRRASAPLAARTARRSARRRHGRQRRDRRPGRHHRALGLRGVLGGADHRPRRRRARRARRPGDRQAARRPGRRALRARPRRHLGHARLRPVHVAAAGRVQRRRRGRACSTPARSSSSACRRSASARRSVRVHRSPRHVLRRSRRPWACGSTAEEEEAGLDISEHGMYGYPEQFIPAAGAPGLRAVGRRHAARGAIRDAGAAVPRRAEEVPAMKKIEAYIRHEAFEPIRTELLSSGSRRSRSPRSRGPGARRASPSATAARS